MATPTPPMIYLNICTWENGENKGTRLVRDTRKKIHKIKGFR